MTLKLETWLRINNDPKYCQCSFFQLSPSDYKAQLTPLPRLYFFYWTRSYLKSDFSSVVVLRLHASCDLVSPTFFLFFSHVDNPKKWKEPTQPDLKWNLSLPSVPYRLTTSPAQSPSLGSPYSALTARTSRRSTKAAKYGGVSAKKTVKISEITARW